jgi:tetratricopeptide (TPR) repeat protein
MEADANAVRSNKLAGTQLLAMCTVCLAIGILAGYLLRGSAATAVSARPAATQPNPASASASTSNHGSANAPHKMPSLDDMKNMADKKAAPVIEKLKADEKNPQLANQVGQIYESAHQFQQAAEYFKQSLQNDPKNVAVRADYASCLYYTGDVDGAIAQLNQSLVYEPKHAGTLMNLGIIKWKGKNDVDGAVAEFQKVLQYHPDFPQKDMVQHMITQAKQMKTEQAASKGQKG